MMFNNEKKNAFNFLNAFDYESIYFTLLVILLGLTLTLESANAYHYEIGSNFFEGSNRISQLEPTSAEYITEEFDPITLEPVKRVVLDSSFLDSSNELNAVPPHQNDSLPYHRFYQIHPEYVEYSNLADVPDVPNRMDIVLMGDGYQMAELKLFGQRAKGVLEMLKIEKPYQQYLKATRVFVYEIPSIDSGVDNLPYGTTYNTSLNVGRSCNSGGTCFDYNRVQNYLTPINFEFDQVLIVANTHHNVGYSGATLYNAQIVTMIAPQIFPGYSDLIPRVALHEMGHSIGALADEYIWSNSTYQGGEPFNSNMTTARTFAELMQHPYKWGAWVNRPEFPEIGLFEGGMAYYRYGVFRPTLNSAMNNSETEGYGHVNAEAVRIGMTRFFKPIEKSSPNWATIPKNADPQPFAANRELSVSLLPAYPNHVKAYWKMFNENGTVVQSSQLTKFKLNPPTRRGTYIVELVVIDHTPLRQNPNLENALTERRYWRIVL